jgi:hypothetical protein
MPYAPGSQGREILRAVIEVKAKVCAPVLAPFARAVKKILDLFDDFGVLTPPPHEAAFPR